MTKACIPMGEYDQQAYVLDKMDNIRILVGKNDKHNHSEGYPPFKNACWIYAMPDPAPNTYAYFRKNFRSEPHANQQYSLRIAADTYYMLFLNGEFIARGPITSGSQWIRYDEIDVSSYIRNGINLLAILHYYDGVGNFRHNSKKAGFVCEMLTNENNLLHQCLISDGTWKVLSAERWTRDTPKATYQMGFVEIQDLNKDDPQWLGVNFDDSKWQHAITFDDFRKARWNLAVPRQIPLLTDEAISASNLLYCGYASNCVLSSMPARDMAQAQVSFSSSAAADINATRETSISLTPCIKSHSANVLVYDFKQEIVGFPRLEITTEQDTVIDLACGEQLQDKRVIAYLKQDDSLRLCNAHRFIVPEGRHLLRPAQHRSGFRYLEIHIRNMTGKVWIHSVSADDTRYPVEKTGTFTCDDNVLNRIWEICAHTLSSCMLDFYVDCPWREQAQWWGDARIEALTNYYLFGDAALANKGHREMAASQRADGLLRCIYPGIYDRIIPNISLTWIQSLRDYWWYTSDLALLKDLWPVLVKLLAGLRQYSSSILLDTFDQYDPITGKQFWNFIDWGTMKNEGAQTALNLLYADALNCAASIASTLGHNREAQIWNELRFQIIQALKDILWEPERRCFVDGTNRGKRNKSISEATNFLALALGCMPIDGIATMQKWLTQLPSDVIPINSSYFEFFRFQALAENDSFCSTELQEQIQSRFGKILESGLVGIPECLKIEGMPENIASCCHAYGAHPAYWLMANILGLRPIAPGWKRSRWRPNPGNLRQMSGIVPTPRGEIFVSCQRHDNIWHLDARHPHELHLELDFSMLAHEPANAQMDSKPIKSHKNNIVEIPGGHHSIIIG